MVDQKIAEWREASSLLTDYWRGEERDKDGYVKVRDQMIITHATLVGIDHAMTVLNLHYWLNEDQRKVLRNL